MPSARCCDILRWRFFLRLHVDDSSQISVKRADFRRVEKQEVHGVHVCREVKNSLQPTFHRR